MSDFRMRAFGVSLVDFTYKLYILKVLFMFFRWMYFFNIELYVDMLGVMFFVFMFLSVLMVWYMLFWRA